MTGTRFALSALALCFLCSGTLAGPSFRIWGGEDVTAGKYPWVASVRVNGLHACMGSIIGAKSILTAATCVSKLNSLSIEPELVSVRVGSTNQYAGGQTVGVEKIKIHVGFANYINNLAILRLKQPLVWSQKVRSIEFAGIDTVVPVDALVSLAGWGLLKTGASPYRMQETKMSVMSPHKCEEKAGYGFESIICLQHSVNEGICTGDQGAGVVYNNTLVGVASFAFGACGTELPDISTKVAYYNKWINSAVAKFEA